MPQANDPNTPYPLNPIVGNTLPKARLDDANVAQQIYWNTHQANLARNNYGAYLQSVSDGMPPYRQASLRSSGQGWRANFSEREAKARKSAGKTPFYDLFASGDTYCEATTDVRDGPVHPDDASGIITSEFHKMLLDWVGFELNFWKMLDSFVGFGRGWLFWPSPDSWHFKSLPWWKVRFPDGTDVDSSEWSLFTIEHEYDPVNLNSFIRDAGSASALGWNVDRVKTALKNATPVDPQSAEDQMAVQQMIADQDIQMMYRASTVQAASVFVKEFDGTWSRMIVETGKSVSDVDLGTGDWLYYKRGVADNIQQVIAPFIFEVDTGSINGCCGILADIVDIVKAKNRLRCEQFNNGFLRSTVLMQATNASSRVKSGLITVGGGVTLISDGLTVQQSTILGDVATASQLIEEAERTLDTNTGVFRPQMEKPSGNPEPLGTTQLRHAQASVLTNSAVARFQQQSDAFYQECYRRAAMQMAGSQKVEAIKAAKAFQKAVKNRGVTEKQMRDATVKAVRVIGNGSPAMRTQLTGELAQLLPVLNLGQRGRNNLARIIIAARGGQKMVDRLKPVEDEQDIPTSQDREAMEENAVVKIGSPVLVIENDDHIVHLRRHFEAAGGAMQSVQQGAPPHDVAAFVQGIMPHIVQHIQQLQDKNAQKQAMKGLKQLQQQYQQLIAAIKQATPDPQKQQEAMSDIQLKAMDTQSRIQDRNLKTQAQLRDKEIKSRHAMALQDMEARQRMGIADAESAADITRDTLLATTKRNGE